MRHKAARDAMCFWLLKQNGHVFAPQAKQAHTATASYASHWGK